jgi:GT2 family glycosyltransferase
MENKFAIGIPTINRLDLLHPALLFYLRDFPTTKIFIIDNGKQNIDSKIKHPNIIVTESETNLGVAMSWNLLCEKIYENHDYALILNDDIYLGRTEWEINALLTNPDFKSDFYVGTHDWCSFILPNKTFKQVGEFDNLFFPAYYEDNDYAYRMKLLGMKYLSIPYLHPYLYKASQTIEKDSSLRSNILANKDRYIEKWGGEPSREKFKTPYNK